MRTARICGGSGTCHVVSRGVGQQIIFEADADRRRYLGSLKSLPKGERDGALARMKERGLTVRQIQRLTGVSLGVISQA